MRTVGSCQGGTVPVPVEGRPPGVGTPGQEGKHPGVGDSPAVVVDIRKADPPVGYKAVAALTSQLLQYLVSIVCYP